MRADRRRMKSWNVVWRTFFCVSGLFYILACLSFAWAFLLALQIQSTVRWLIFDFLRFCLAWICWWFLACLTEIITHRLTLILRYCFWRYLRSLTKILLNGFIFSFLLWHCLRDTTWFWCFFCFFWCFLLLFLLCQLWPLFVQKNWTFGRYINCVYNRFCAAFFL